MNTLPGIVAELVRRGASGGRSRDRGLALDWSRLAMSRRRDEMKRGLIAAFALVVAAGRLHEWLEQTGKIEHIVSRAKGWRIILGAIRKVNE